MAWRCSDTAYATGHCEHISASPSAVFITYLHRTLITLWFVSAMWISRVIERHCSPMSIVATDDSAVDYSIHNNSWKKIRFFATYIDYKKERILTFLLVTQLFQQWTMETNGYPNQLPVPKCCWISTIWQTPNYQKWLHLHHWAVWFNCRFVSEICQHLQKNQQQVASQSIMQLTFNFVFDWQ